MFPNLKDLFLDSSHTINKKKIFKKILLSISRTLKTYQHKRLQEIVSSLTWIVTLQKVWN